MAIALTLPIFAHQVFGMEFDANQREMGVKYSPLTHIDVTNVANLQLAWEYHTGETDRPERSLDAFEDEPSLIEEHLIICTPMRRIIALDPATGDERWTFDPETKIRISQKCRGVASWVDDRASADSVCRTRILFGTEDNQLVAIDAANGKPCEGFGANGFVKIKSDEGALNAAEVTGASWPAVVNGVVIIGTNVNDNQRLNAPSGRIFAFDARTGEELWVFDPVPRSSSDPAMATWEKGTTKGIGGANVWAEMAVDESLDLVYLPTSSPSVDYYGGDRPGAGAYANSIVALQGATGKVVWYQQLVHHDIWDYDVPAQPILINLPREGEVVPALVQITKMGLIFVFNRETGEPLFPIEERPVPQEGAGEGEWLSPTQPFPVGISAVMPLKITPEDAWGFTPIDRWMCKRRISELNYGPIYTPPSEKGTTMHPAPAGGPNWGGGAYDPKSHLMVIPTNRVPMVITLIPREHEGVAMRERKPSQYPYFFPSVGTPYIPRVEPLLSPLGAPCTAPPWAALTALDLSTGTIRWEVPLGSIEKELPVPIPWKLGSPGAGGALVTAGGLVFIGFSNDDKFRAFDLETGEILWTTRVPAAAMATPVSYEINGEQYVVIATGGHSMWRAAKGDAVMAYKVKR